MQRKRIFIGWSYYLFGPIILVLVAFAIWVALAASLETYRAAQANAQIVDIIAEARQMNVPKEAAAERASQELFRRFSASGMYDIVQIKGAFLGSDPERGLMNPWGGTVRVFFYPAMSSFRIETAVSALACQKILLKLAAQDNKVLKLRRVDIKEDDPARLWRLVYEEGKGVETKTLMPNVIYGGCGEDTQNLLSLTFYL